MKRTLSCVAGSGSIDDMLVGCLWQNDHLVTVSLGGTISLFSASNPNQMPVSFSGHMKSVSSLACFLQDGRKSIVSSSYDGIIIRWIQGVGFGGKLKRKNSSQIKCFSGVREEFIVSGFDNKVYILFLFVSFFLTIHVLGVADGCAFSNFVGNFEVVFINRRTC